VWGGGGDKDPDLGPGMNIPDPISESLETIWVTKYLNPLRIRIRDPESFSGSGKEKIRIRDKHPGSATLTESITGGGSVWVPLGQAVGQGQDLRAGHPQRQTRLPGQVSQGHGKPYW
jgi:hypothetical protein